MTGPSPLTGTVSISLKTPKNYFKAVDDGQRCLVVGKRQGMEGKKNVPWTSRFGRKFSNFWVWVSGGPLIEDSQSGFRLYPLPEVLAA